MAVLTPPPKLRFFDDDGDPLAGGKVYTYELGTTTPLTTYKDRAKVASNTNPIILDSYGRCAMWLDDTAATLAVYNSNDELQSEGGDVDPVTALEDLSDDIADNATAIALKADADEIFLDWEVVISDDTIVAGEGFLVDTTDGAAAVTITLPASPAITDKPIGIADLRMSFNTYNCILDRNENKLAGLEEDMYLDIDGLSIRLQYSGSTYGWILL